MAATATTTYIVLVMWARPTLATPDGKMLPEVPVTSAERTFSDKGEAWAFIQEKLAGATSKLYECGIVVAADFEVVYRTNNFEMLPR